MFICCCGFWFCFCICISGCWEFLLDMFRVKIFELNVDWVGLLVKGDEFCFFLFLLIFWDMGKDDFWDELFFDGFSFGFLYGGVIDVNEMVFGDNGDFVMINFIFGFDFVVVFI